ncbi:MULTISPECIES: KpsF/GutQ family sugar-phosphate isomerase [Marinobacter]|jgi:arabinose-5-phosphate isomerase|uniref:Arabinose 5-phosphate isomerase n=8 Tax=Marinobacter TaxID=2742 RepID=A0A350RTI7_MARNT|nr:MULTISPECIES: KpsF/GutQ family sugar-phosphate isomerase [Marinobacter]MCG8522740.1 KpsF/GutQ family sugar-phosphate isomerase [Pseudomonadales bacterium]MEC8823700.1 KpsF/GutQ family sugar-phosphate isomerase [Pseudomonadota bacterium]ABM19785.1 KpsF/GutQ family protein [Marinobacter nauticus VT8]ERS84345.1 D-arabinose 5-phosphate isomerase [Marinobacter sp. EVN1]KAE8544889.1 D-arabinose 5-phosphate isomerase [Marinobacter nauticus]|tara:strand:+ start:2379 stop:3368 length:990 start_codon:yes stop_codon:yes gene_type:complete
MTESNTFNTQDFCNSALRAIRIEREAIEALESRINGDFSRACEVIMACKGRVVVTGMGKSGHIGNKIAATLASTGTPAFFVHPGEASHGDLGMITPQDVVIAISNSGSTSEVVTILPLIKRMGAPLISMTGKPDSVLAQEAVANLDVSVAIEACPLGLAPTSSTTATLVMGDALAVALLEARGFSAEDFAFSHPGGSLGRRLLLRVSDIMHTGDQIPQVAEGTTLSGALLEITRKGLGMTTVVNAAGTLTGIFTDGDLRRTLDKSVDVHTTPIQDVMTRNGKTIRADHLAAEALNIMEEMKINALPVTDANGTLVGAINMHDLLRAGVI